MKSYLVRITPLIFECQAAFLRHSAMSPVSRPGCAGIRASPWVVEAQVVAPVPRWFVGRGSTGRSGNKKTPRLCAEVSDLIY